MNSEGYKILPKATVIKYLKEAQDNKVSKVARSKGGFTHWYLNTKDYDNVKWWSKRKGFIDRTLAQYIKNPTHRRYLSLIMWAYDPLR